jgi:hypothetical protein
VDAEILPPEPDLAAASELPVDIRVLGSGESLQFSVRYEGLELGQRFAAFIEYVFVLGAVEYVDTAPASGSRVKIARPRAAASGYPFLRRLRLDWVKVAGLLHPPNGFEFQATAVIP